MSVSTKLPEYLWQLEITVPVKQFFTPLAVCQMYDRLVRGLRWEDWFPKWRWKARSAGGKWIAKVCGPIWQCYDKDFGDGQWLVVVTTTPGCPDEKEDEMRNFWRDIEDEYGMDIEIYFTLI